MNQKVINENNQKYTVTIDEEVHRYVKKMVNVLIHINRSICIIIPVFAYYELATLLLN